MSIITFTFVIIVAFVNGWTDAPNSVAACVATGILPIKKALKYAAIADFAGSITFGIISGKVTERITYLATLGNNKDDYIILTFSVMMSVIIFSIVAWYFGIPTSESHAVLAGVFGSSVCLNRGFGNFNYSEWINTFLGLFFSVVTGYIVGYFFTKIFARFYNKSFEIKLHKLQIISSLLTAFMHGAQDSQKFSVIASAILIPDNKNISLSYIVHIAVALAISFGVISGGERIIKKLGNELVEMNLIQGFSADFSGVICILYATIYGFPVSTTHIKTSAIIGAGMVNGSVDKKITFELIASWILTFPICAILSFLFICLIKK